MTDQEKKFDGLLMTVMREQKQISGFFDRVFGFLRRNTDFFSNQKLAQDAITSTCKKNFQIFHKEKAQKQQQQARKKKKEEEKKQKEKEKEKDASTSVPKAESKVQQPKKSEPVEALSTTNPAQSGEKEKDEPAPKGNGGRNDKYIWTQTLDELHMYIPIRSDINKKMLTVKINTQSLLIQESGQSSMIDGKFYEKIKADDSIWTIEDGQIDDYKGKYIHLAIQKWKNQNSWWPTPIKGDPEINTQKINPEPSKLEDLQGETKATVGKMMFDMRQKQMGKPTSDELQKQDKLQQFMKAHPEMDFSNCKFN